MKTTNGSPRGMYTLPKQFKLSINDILMRSDWFAAIDLGGCISRMLLMKV
jgi:hypothetical protein